MRRVSLIALIAAGAMAAVLGCGKDRYTSPQTAYPAPQAQSFEGQAQVESEWQSPEGQEQLTQDQSGMGMGMGMGDTSQPTIDCPDELTNATVAVSDSPEGVVLSFTTTGDLEQLRTFVRQTADDHNASSGAKTGTDTKGSTGSGTGSDVGSDIDTEGDMGTGSEWQEDNPSGPGGSGYGEDTQSLATEGGPKPGKSGTRGSQSGQSGQTGAGSSPGSETGQTGSSGMESGMGAQEMGGSEGTIQVHAQVKDIANGVQLALHPQNPSELEELRFRVRKQVELSRAQGCPINKDRLVFHGATSTPSPLSYLFVSTGLSRKR